jgi:hypothetical protein
MRIEHHHGTNIVCGHIFHHTSIKVGQVWRGSSGSKVTVTGRDADWVTYMQSNGVPHTKDAFSFQCRYCLDIGDATEVPDELAQN